MPLISKLLAAFEFWLDMTTVQFAGEEKQKRFGYDDKSIHGHSFGFLFLFVFWVVFFCFFVFVSFVLFFVF